MRKLKGENNKNWKKEIIKLIVIIALAIIIDGAVYVLLSKEKIELPKMEDLVKDD